MSFVLPVRAAAALWAAVALIGASAPAAAMVPARAPAPSTAQPDDLSSVLTWGVAPSSPDGPDGRSSFDYKLDPGAELTDYLAVTNHSTEELTLRVYASDAFTTPDGGFDLLPAVDQPTDVGSWITLDTPDLTIPPRSRVDVPFRLDIPGNATPGDHAGGLVAALATADSDQDGGQVLVEHRVGARVYLRVSGELDPRLTVEQLDADYAGTLHPGRGGELAVSYQVRNTGNVRLTGVPRVEVAGPFGIGRRSVTLAPLPEILPGDTLAGTASVAGVPPMFRVVGTVEVVPDDPAAMPSRRQESVWAAPWSQLLLLLLVAAAVAIWWWRRRRARNRLAAALAAARRAGRNEANRGAARDGTTSETSDDKPGDDKASASSTSGHEARTKEASA